MHFGILCSRGVARMSKNCEKAANTVTWYIRCSKSKMPEDGPPHGTPANNATLFWPPTPGGLTDWYSFRR